MKAGMYKALMGMVIAEAMLHGSDAPGICPNPPLDTKIMEELKAEYDLIKAKKSKLSKAGREEVVKLWEKHKDGKE